MKKEPDIKIEVCSEDIDVSPYVPEFKVQTKPCPIPTKQKIEEIRKLNFKRRNKLVARVKLCLGDKKCKCWFKKGSKRYKKELVRLWFERRKDLWKIMPPAKNMKKYYGLRLEKEIKRRNNEMP